MERLKDDFGDGLAGLRLKWIENNMNGGRVFFMIYKAYRLFIPFSYLALAISSASDFQFNSKQEHA